MIGFIGTGNMASAMIGGILQSGLHKAEEIIVSDASDKAKEALAFKYPGLRIAADNKEAARNSEILILAVKPHIYPHVVEEIAAVLPESSLLVTIAAGVTLANMENWMGTKRRIVRTMPNTPALVGEGMAALCPNDQVQEQDIESVEKLFQCFGRTERLPENQINAFTSLCGSSPAWIFMAIESLADGAVLKGLPRQKAYTMAAQAVLGSAKMVLETGEHPGVLKDRVCSPGGTTIEALASLERDGFRTALIEAIEVCTEKADLLSGA